VWHFEKPSKLVDLLKTSNFLCKVPVTKVNLKFAKVEVAFFPAIYTAKKAE